MFLNIIKCFKIDEISFNDIDLIKKTVRNCIKIDLDNQSQVDKVKQVKISFMIGKYYDRYTITTNYYSIFIHDKKNEKIKFFHNSLFDNNNDIQNFVINIYNYLNRKKIG